MGGRRGSCTCKTSRKVLQCHVMYNFTSTQNSASLSLSLSLSPSFTFVHSFSQHTFYSFKGYCRLALRTRATDSAAHNPQCEGVYNCENSIAIVAEGDTPAFNSLKRLTSVSSDTFNGLSLTVMDICDLQGETVSFE